MKFLTIDYIRAHSRLDFDCENNLVEVYGSSAEEVVLNILGRTLEDIREEFNGEVPANIIHAALLLTDFSYQHRTAAESIPLSAIPYGVDFLLLPYTKISDT